MAPDAFEEVITSFQRRSPFQPFTVALVNGDRIEVDHPRALAIRDGLAFYWAPGRVPVFFDHEGVNQVIGDLAGRESS